MKPISDLPNCKLVSAGSRASLLRELRAFPLTRLVGRIAPHIFVLATYPNHEAAAELDRQTFSDATRNGQPMTPKLERIQLHLALLESLADGKGILTPELLSVRRLADGLRTSHTPFAYPPLAVELRSLGWARLGRRSISKEKPKEQIWYRPDLVSAQEAEFKLRDFINQLRYLS